MTIEQITMPKLGESVTEGTLNTWLIKVGDTIEKYEPIAEISTDKVNAEIPSSFTGTITELLISEGDTVGVDTPICMVETEADSETTKVESEDVVEPEQGAKVTSADESMKKRYSPAVLRLAGEHELNLEQINGTGLGGRITRKDIQKVISEGYAEQPGKSDSSVEEKDSTLLEKANMRHHQKDQKREAQVGDIEVPISRVRRVVADHMIRAKQEIPHAWMMVEVDVTDLVNYRNSIKDAFRKQEGYNLTFFSFFVKAVAQALKEFPEMNSMWGEDKIIRKKDINLSFAVAKEDELFVPVIKSADEKTVKGIARNIYELATRARDGKLTPEDIEGGTFTVNNTGSFGSVQSMGIINHPQAAILQVESIVKRPVIINDMFAARHMVNLCLSLDHRILDGLVCGNFMARVKEILENINPETASVF